ncbi:hypothetical protein KI387_015830 [Taxus chinensis]|uniref:Alpha/beta-Hydrolases superfamily protein n=1 Tax=Taxus chinensis TaxID=29808 RepID=A0AA38GDG2_TAXCH|nr:hypothetical protein KI387_015830 [Taxus chinensis]
MEILKLMLNRMQLLKDKMREVPENIIAFTTEEEVDEEVALRNMRTSGTKPSKLSYQGSSGPISYFLNGNLCQSVSSTGGQRNISESENTVMNITAPASAINSISSSLGRAGQSLLSIPLNIFGGLAARMERTLRGSTHDIGWLQCTDPVTPVQDGTNRFMELLAMTRNGEHILPDRLVYFLVPGLFSNHFPLYFVDTKNFLSKLGLTCHIAKIHSEASVKTNAYELKKQIENLYLYYGKKVLVFGHSKGGVDAAAAMAMHWPDLKNKVAGLALVQSPYGGTPIASDILGEGQIAEIEKRTILELLMCRFIKGDMSALEDLTYSKRKEFLSQYALPVDLPLISFHTEASTDPQALATLYHIAHVEFPSVIAPSSFLSSNQTVKIPIMAPLATAMAACASYLELRYGEKSDGLVTRKDAEVPGSVVVKPNRKLDHAWMVNPSLAINVTEPDAPQLCEALLALLVEIGQGTSKP